MKKALTRSILAGMLVGALAFTSAFAAETDYSGDFLKRSTLTGDWGGARNDLAKKGVTFSANLVLTEQGVVDGGVNREWETGGRGSLLFKLDTGKLGLWPGGFLTAEPSLVSGRAYKPPCR